VASFPSFLSLFSLRVALKAYQAWDRYRLRRLQRQHPGVEIHPGASTNLAAARWELEPGARVVIDDGLVTERSPGALRIHVEEGGELHIGPGAWLRTEVGPIQLVVHKGARIAFGSGAWLNGCSLSSKVAIDCGERVWIGPGARVYDSDQHTLDAERTEQKAAIKMGSFIWVAAGVTLLKGAHLGSHVVVGADSLVTNPVPDHSLAFGVPARVRGEIGDRSTLVR